MLKKTFSTACVIFTCLVALYSLVNLALYGKNTDSYLALSSLRVFLFFPFSLLLAFGSHILNAKRLDICCASSYTTFSPSPVPICSSSFLWER